MLGYSLFSFRCFSLLVFYSKELSHLSNILLDPFLDIAIILLFNEIFPVCFIDSI